MEDLSSYACARRCVRNVAGAECYPPEFRHPIPGSISANGGCYGLFAVVFRCSHSRSGIRRFLFGSSNQLVDYFPNGNDINYTYYSGVFSRVCHFQASFNASASERSVFQLRCVRALEASAQTCSTSPGRRGPISTCTGT